MGVQRDLRGALLVEKTHGFLLSGWVKTELSLDQKGSDADGRIFGVGIPGGLGSAALRTRPLTGGSGL